MKVTKAKLSDVEELCKLLEELFTLELEFCFDKKLQEKSLCHIIENETLAQILVVKIDEKIVGMCNLLYTYSTALGAKVAILEDVVVKDGFHNQGIGSFLLDEAMSFATKQGCKRVTLLTDLDNHQAHRFYLQNGFKRSKMVVFRRNL